MYVSYFVLPSDIYLSIVLLTVCFGTLGCFLVKLIDFWQKNNKLADEVAQLREENQRLQEESAIAAQQLRRFTEWFFQTIEKA